MAGGAQRQVGLSDLRHLNGGLHAAVHALLLQEVLQGQAVHDRAEHAHVVGAGTVQAALLQLCTAEEIAAADDYGDFHAGLGNLRDLSRHVLHNVRVDADLAAAEHLTPQLQHDALVAFAVFGCSHRGISFVDVFCTAGHTTPPKT